MLRGRFLPVSARLVSGAGAVSARPRRVRGACGRPVAEAWRRATPGAGSPMFPGPETGRGTSVRFLAGSNSSLGRYIEFDGAPAFEGPRPAAGFVHGDRLQAAAGQDDLSGFELDVVVRQAVHEPRDGGEWVAEDVAGGAGDDFLVVEPQDAAGIPKVQVGDPPRGATEDDGTSGAVVRQR